MMAVLFYLAIGLFGLLGFGTLNSALRLGFLHPGLLIAGGAYLGAAVSAYLTGTWWPFATGFALVLVARSLFGDPSR